MMRAIMAGVVAGLALLVLVPAAAKLGRWLKARYSKELKDDEPKPLGEETRPE